MGYSIGKWIDEDGDGRYDALEVETRLLKGPRTFDPSGVPLHKDNQTVVKERFYLDKDNPDLLHDDVTTIDHALTRPWTVNKRYVRVRNPIWVEAICSEGNDHLKIQGEDYMLSADGYIMPAKKNQAPPDLQVLQAELSAARAMKGMTMQDFDDGRRSVGRCALATAARRWAGC